MRKQVLLLTSSLSAFALMAGAAYAQDAGDDSGGVEELVVTAERREQSLQDVPVAISAFTSETRDLVGINSIQDMTNFTPGLVYSSGQDRVSLRGIGRLTNVQAADPGVANYSDGIYTSSLLEASKTPLLVDRIEVLRGPQGTLYGRNSIGGAVNVLSRRPTDEFYAEVRGQIANYDFYILEGAVSGPVFGTSDDESSLRFLVAGSYVNQGDGWFDNVVAGMPDEGNVVEQWYLEGQLAFEVGQFEGWVRVATAGWDNRGGPGARSAFTPFPYNPFLSPPGALTLPGGFAYSGNATLSNINNNGVTANPSVLNERQFAADTAGKVDLDDTWIVAAEFIYHLDNFDLKYVVGGTQYHYTLISDLDGTAVSSYTINPIVPGNGAIQIFPQYISNYQEIKSWHSHEVTLASTYDGPLQFIVGGFFYHEEYDQPVFTTLPNQPQVANPVASLAGFCQGAGLQYNATFTGVVANAACLNAAQILPGPAAAPNPLRRVFDNRPHFEDDSWAIFGQADYEYNDQLTFTFGLRYSEDHKFGTESVRVLCVYTNTCIGGNALVPLGFGIQGSGATMPVTDVTLASISNTAPVGSTGLPTYDAATGFATRRYDYTWDAVTGTLGVNWTPDTNTLVYGRYSRGYKAGGFNVGISSAIGPFPWTDAESADAFELGLKRNWGRVFQLNAAIFYYLYQDAQAPLSIVDATGGTALTVSRFLNIPESVTRGFELETIWAPIENLQILFNYSYNDAQITDLCCVVDPEDPAAINPRATPVGPSPSTDIYTNRPTRAQDLRGNTLPNAPNNKIAINVQYTWVFDPGSLTASVSYVWRDEQYSSVFNRSYNRSPAWDQTDMRAIWKDTDDRYTVILFVKNVFDEIGYTGGAVGGRSAGTTNSPFSVGVFQTGSTYPLIAPRTFGIEGQFRFR